MTNLEQFRKDNKLSQREVAEYLGVSPAFISNIERGRSHLPQDKLDLLVCRSGWNTNSLNAPAQPVDNMEKEITEIVSKLAKVCEDNMNMYDKHLTSLEESRNIALRSMNELIVANSDLTKFMEELRKEYTDYIDSLKAELHKLTNEYREELKEWRDDCRRLSDAYIRISETTDKKGSKAEVKINQSI